MRVDIVSKPAELRWKGGVKDLNVSACSSFPLFVVPSHQLALWGREFDARMARKEPPGDATSGLTCEDRDLRQAEHPVAFSSIKHPFVHLSLAISEPLSSELQSSSSASSAST